MKFADLSVKDRQEIIRRVQAENGLHLQIIEKDWWVTAVAGIVRFALCGAHLLQGRYQSEQVLASHQPNVRGCRHCHRP